MTLGKMILRYQPPKSNIWGHSLRKMKPSIERALSGEFEEAAVARLSFSASSLWISRKAADRIVPQDLISRFEAAVQKESKEGFFHLSEVEFERAFAVLVTCESALSDIDATIALSRIVRIQEWRIAGVPVPTSSSVHWDFGSSPGISTFLSFGDRAEFDYVREVLERLKICRLNEKHLKPQKKSR